MSPVRCSFCGEMDYSDVGDIPCYCRYMERQWPTDEDYCASDGHSYYGDDCGVGRCYCGHRSYPCGGPTPSATPGTAGRYSYDEEAGR